MYLRVATIDDAPTLPPFARRCFHDTYVEHPDMAEVPRKVLFDYMDDSFSPATFAAEVAEEGATYLICAELVEGARNEEVGAGDSTNGEGKGRKVPAVASTDPVEAPVPFAPYEAAFSPTTPSVVWGPPRNLSTNSVFAAKDGEKEEEKGKGPEEENTATLAAANGAVGAERILGFARVVVNGRDPSLAIGKDPATGEAERPLRLHKLYVGREFIGRRGVGSMLLAASEGIGRANKCDFVWLGAWKPNTAAIGFYEKKGFRHANDMYFEMGGKQYVDTMMRKDLPK